MPNDRHTARFRAAADKGEMSQEVVIARQCVTDGLLGSGLALVEDVSDLAGELSGFDRSVGSERWQTFCRHERAVFALGVAVGQLLHPDVFTKGGAQ